MNSTGKARSQDLGILPSVKELGKLSWKNIALMVTRANACAICLTASPKF